MKITDSIKYVGVNDHSIDLFEGQYDVPNGMAYNSYVIMDKQIAVLDTVDTRFFHEWLDNLEKVLDGRKPDALKDRIDDTVILKNRLPCISAKKEVHPHGEHDEHGHHFLSCKAESGHRKSKRICQHQTKHRCDRGKRNTLDKRGNIFHSLLSVCHCKRAIGIRERKINDKKERNDREKDHPNDIRIRSPFRIQFQPFSPPKSERCMIWISSGFKRIPI